MPRNKRKRVNEEIEVMEDDDNIVVIEKTPHDIILEAVSKDISGLHTHLTNMLDTIMQNEKIHAGQLHEAINKLAYSQQENEPLRGEEDAKSERNKKSDRLKLFVQHIIGPHIKRKMCLKPTSALVGGRPKSRVDLANLPDEILENFLREKNKLAGPRAKEISENFTFTSENDIDDLLGDFRVKAPKNGLYARVKSPVVVKWKYVVKEGIWQKDRNSVTVSFSFGVYSEKDNSECDWTTEPNSILSE